MSGARLPLIWESAQGPTCGGLGRAQPGAGMPGGGSGHSDNYRVPPGSYFRDHPEYYALQDGKRVTSQLCTTNPEVIPIAIETTRKVLRDHSGAHQCERCMALDPQPGCWTDRILFISERGSEDSCFRASAPLFHFRRVCTVAQVCRGRRFGAYRTDNRAQATQSRDYPSQDRQRYAVGVPWKAHSRRQLLAMA